MTVHEPALWDVLENHGTNPCVWGHEECSLTTGGACSLWPLERWLGVTQPAGMADSRWWVLSRLASGPHCASELGEGGRRFGARIRELRQDGWQIEKRTCRRRFHRHDTHQYEYVLVGIPDGAEEEETR